MNEDSTPYSNREINVKFKVLEDKIDSAHARTIEKIELSDRRNHDQQVTILSELGEINTKLNYTNGKVKNLQMWKFGLAMAGSASITLIMVIIGMATYIYQQDQQTIKDRLDRQSSWITKLLDVSNLSQE